MMGNTYSQRVARAFEIVDYILLIPAAIGALVGFLAIARNPLFTLLIYTVLGVGITLLVGYYKHSRGRLAEKWISALWITTAVFNFLLLLPWLYLTSSVINEEAGKSLFVVLVFVNLGYIGAIVSSIRAYSFEKRKSILFAKMSSSII